MVENFKTIAGLLQPFKHGRLIDSLDEYLLEAKKTKGLTADKKYKFKSDLNIQISLATEPQAEAAGTERPFDTAIPSWELDEESDIETEVSPESAPNLIYYTWVNSHKFFFEKIQSVIERSAYFQGTREALEALEKSVDQPRTQPKPDRPCPT